MDLNVLFAEMSIFYIVDLYHYDFVYSYIDLEIHEDLSDELAKCSGSILIDHLKNEVGARCGSLTANAVTLNFCLDVVRR